MAARSVAIFIEMVGNRCHVRELQKKVTECLCFDIYANATRVVQGRQRGWIEREMGVLRISKKGNSSIEANSDDASVSA